MPTQKKIDTVEDLREKISRATIAIGTDFTGLRVAEMNALRRTMRAANIEVRVIKNNLLKLAAEQAQIPRLMDIIEGPTALILAYDEITEAARALDDYARTAPPTFAVRGAYLDGQVVSAEDLKALVRLPAKPVLLAQIAGQLQSPLATFVGLLEAPLRELSLLVQTLLGELPGLVEARAKQLEAQGAPPGGTASEASAATVAEEAPADAPAAASEEPAEDAPTEAPTEEPPADEAPAQEAAPEPPAEEPAAEAPVAEEPTEEPPAEEAPAEEAAPEPPASEPAAEPAAEAAADESPAETNDDTPADETPDETPGESADQPENEPEKEE